MRCRIQMRDDDLHEMTPTTTTTFCLSTFVGKRSVVSFAWRRQSSKSRLGSIAPIHGLLCVCRYARCQCRLSYRNRISTFDLGSCYCSVIGANHDLFSYRLDKGIGTIQIDRMRSVQFQKVGPGIISKLLHDLFSANVPVAVDGQHVHILLLEGL